MILPFDSHNHIHLGPTPPLQALLGPTASLTDASAAAAVSGVAIMSTHPRDFDRVIGLAKELPLQRPSVRVIPCFGVHPWFLHELMDSDWAVADDDASFAQLPKWAATIEQLVAFTPGAIVGEIGLDGFHFDPVTKELVSPMEKQVLAFQIQMEIAARLQKPVSVHGVQCFGSLMETLSQLKKSKIKLPPKIYFHAFGGKLGTVDQLLALCGKEPGQVYFGFASVVNFRSSKTKDVIRRVGIERLVLESDHEDAALVPTALQDCIRYVAEALELDEQTVIEATTANAYDLYGLE